MIGKGVDPTPPHYSGIT